MTDDDVEEEKAPNHRIVECCFTCEHVKVSYQDCTCTKFSDKRYTEAHNICDGYSTDGTTIGMDY